MFPTEIARHPISVVIDGPLVPRWQRRALEALQARERLIVREVCFAGGGRRDQIRDVHAAFERRLFAAGPDALAPVSIEEVRDGAGDVELVVWLAEGSAPPGGGPPTLQLRHDGRCEGAEPAFRRACLRGQPWVVSEAVLQRGGEERLIERTVSGARPYSVTLSRDKALWKLAEMVARAAERAVTNPVGIGEPPMPQPPSSRAPSIVELLARSSWRWGRIVAGRALYDRPWQVRVRPAQAEPTAGWDRPARSPVAWRPGHLYADPFLFEHEGRHHLFCEEIPRGSERGVISHVELEPGGRNATPQLVLAEPHHLSYPFVFAHEGEIFLIPETSSERRVTLYRAVDFPRRWRREAVLLDGLRASDATLLAHAGRLWLFVGVAAEHATMLDELHLFSADSLTAEWHPHPRNPIVSDVRCARPAGAIRHWGTALVRPAQDCGRRYGGAVSFRQIDVLTEDDYAEHEIARLEPGDLGDGARATHTYAADGVYEATDLRKRSLRSPAQGLRTAQRMLRVARGRR
jgi:hypothetical protein